MARWEPEARNRLIMASFELYSERGFEQTTVAEIAARAGLSERTFFRHFTDKREVLFSGAEQLVDTLNLSIAAAAHSMAPIDMVASAIAAIGGFFEGRRSHSQGRQLIINAHPELQERELIKLAALADTLAQALRARGVAEPTASLAAESGIAVLKIAFAHWLDSSEDQELAEISTSLFVNLRAVTSGA